MKHSEVNDCNIFQTESGINFLASFTNLIVYVIEVGQLSIVSD
jgi:hypothetical protein